MLPFESSLASPNAHFIPILHSQESITVTGHCWEAGEDEPGGEAGEDEDEAGQASNAGTHNRDRYVSDVGLHIDMGYMGYMTGTCEVHEVHGVRARYMS